MTKKKPTERGFDDIFQVIGPGRAWEKAVKAKIKAKLAEGFDDVAKKEQVALTKRVTRSIKPVKHFLVIKKAKVGGGFIASYTTMKEAKDMAAQIPDTVAIDARKTAVPIVGCPAATPNKPALKSLRESAKVLTPRVLGYE